MLAITLLLVIGCGLVLGTAQASGSVNDICPDRNSTCPDSTTCCPIQGGGYGCCPFGNAFCCPDKRHCCRNGYHCTSNACIPDQMERVEIGNPQTIVCPDKKSTCPDGSTCCALSENGITIYACCPLPNAVCCSDKAHCCPSGTQCDLAHETCIKQDGTTVPIMAHTMAVAPKLEKVEIQSGIVPCSPFQYCNDGNTCCMLSTGQWGCCPYPSATCCTDGVHCCQNGYRCISGMCMLAEHVQPWIKQLPATLLTSGAKPTASSVVCPDEQSQCEDGNTCCKLTSGSWGCCPLPEATCCDDGEHCCPHATRCESGRCLSSNGFSVPWSTKVKANRIPAAKVSLVVCPDGVSQCNEGNTCCKLVDGNWGCCPLPEATCCDDGEHCCPHGSKCESGRCLSRKGHSVPWSTKVKANLIPAGNDL